MPKLREESFGSGDQTWLGSTHGLRNGRTGVIDPAAFTKADHFPDGFIRSGTPVNAADEQALKPFTGAEGEQLGFVLFDQKVGTAKLPVSVLRHGTIDVANLPGAAFTVPTNGAVGFVFVNTGNGGAS